MFVMQQGALHFWGISNAIALQPVPTGYFAGS
jgi:hypothetical protein